MAFDFPEKFFFADTHEYANSEEELVRIGISAFAVDQLGDIVFVDLPDVGSTLERGVWEEGGLSSKREGFTAFTDFTV